MNEVDEYINSFPNEVQEKLNIIRDTIFELIPGVTEKICMKIPTYYLNGKWFIHFAGYKKHIGFYPQPESIIYFKDKLKGYKTSTGTIQFSLNEKLPINLIREIIKHKLENQSK